MKCCCRKKRSQRRTCLMAASWKRQELSQQLQYQSTRSSLAHTKGRLAAERMPGEVGSIQGAATVILQHTQFGWHISSLLPVATSYWSQHDLSGCSPPGRSSAPDEPVESTLGLYDLYLQAKPARQERTVAMGM